MDTASDGRVVVVSGANRGIGYHMLAALVADGYRVAGLDVDGENLEALRDTDPERVRFYECDVSESEDVRTAIAGVLDEWGRIDILVNNAAVATFAPFAEQSEADTCREFEVNYFGYLRTIRAVLPHMRSRDAGIIHNVSSGTAIGGHPGLTGYASTKGAIEAFTRSLRLELHEENVSCTLMQPPTSSTRMTAELGYPDWMLADPADVGRKLASKVESTDPVVTADLRTRVGLYLVRRFPSLWRRATERFVTGDE